MSVRNEQQEMGPAAQRFNTTHWSVVLAAGEASSPDAQAALEKLCRTYWYPLYAYVRRKGHSAHDAEDLTQGFFAQLLARESISQVRGEGKFRSFLLSALEHFLAAEWNRARRQKRGGNCSVISLDAPKPEERYKLEPLDEQTAERIYERRWAMIALEQALDKLQGECHAAHKDELFERMKGTLTGESDAVSYADLGARLKMSEGAVKVAAHRLRQRYGELVREEIAQTVSSQGELDEEIRHLFAVLRY